MGGNINDPSNRTMRRNLMSYGLGQFCQQLTSHSAPLKLTADAPVTGRFYPRHCTQQTLDNGDLWVQFDGQGYAFTDLSRKVTFTAGASLQYNEDFKCADNDAIYAYFMTRTAAPPTFQVVQIEAPVASLMSNVVGPYANSFGTQMLTKQLAEGFTVVQSDNGAIDFDLGKLPVGQPIKHPFDVHGSDKLLVESQRVQIANNERDFVGPIEIKDSGRALYFLMGLEGGQAVDILLMPKAQGEQALQNYLNVGPVGALPAPAQWSDVVRFGQQYQRALPVPPGVYYVVIDNTPSAGQVAPPASLPFGASDPPAVVNYAIQIGDAP